MAGDVGPTRVVARAVGIGLPMAAAGAAMHVGERRPGAVVAIGTCGAYAGSGLALGEVVVARKMRLVDLSVLRGSSQYPEPMSVVTEASPALSGAIARATSARMVDVATTLGITVDDIGAALIARTTGAEVEHLEAHGVATACAARGVPFAAVLGVANVVGADARAQWRIHHRSAAAAAVEALLRWLREDRGAGLQRGEA
jgi:nucleoside phosphorylase